MNNDLLNWNLAAADWNEQIAQKNTFRTHLITGALEKLLPDVQNKAILDAGCGNGYYSNWLTERGAQVFGIDGSSEMIKIAQQKYPKTQFKVHDLTQPLNDTAQKYDIILANMLFMHMNDISVFLKDSRRLLKPAGEIIFSILHPCFNQPTSKLYKSWWQKLTGANPNSLAKDYYTHMPGRFESHFKTKLSHYHRTLEDYTDELQKAGLVTTNIVEPHTLPKEFLDKNPKLEYATRLPRFIFFKCKIL